MARRAPRGAALKRLFLALLLVAHRSDVAVAAAGPTPAPPECSWCADGDAQCDTAQCEAIKGVLSLSISAQVGGRGLPYWHAAGAAPLDAGDAYVKHVLLSQHGTLRNGAEYFCYAHNAATKRLERGGGGARRRRWLILATQVFERDDPALDPATDLWWPSQQDGVPLQRTDWVWGANSTGDLPASMAYYRALDELLLTLVDRRRFPRLATVHFLGHSAGAQAVQRYALLGQAHGALRAAGVELTYLVADASSYLYLNPSRPVLAPLSPPTAPSAAWSHRRALLTGASASASAAAAALGLPARDPPAAVPEGCRTFCDNVTLLTRRFEFAAPAAARCPRYNDYGYGLEGELAEYSAGTDLAAAVAAYFTKRVVYISGESDVCNHLVQERLGCDLGCAMNDHHLDQGCGAMLQGWVPYAA